jgi:hypothetical protein
VPDASRSVPAVQSLLAANADVWKSKGLKIVEHTGFTMGFKAHLAHFPEAGLTVFVLSNNENTDPKDIALKIVDWSIKDQLKPEPGLKHKEIAINKELNKLYEGSYLFSDGMVLQFDNVNDTLKLIIPGAPKFIMYPENDNEFFLKDFDAQCTFVKDSKGTVNEIIWHQSNLNPKGVRYFKPKPLTQEELQSFTGNYEIPGFNTSFPVSLIDNELTIALPKTFRMVNIDTNLKLKHTAGNKFYGSLGMIEFKRNEEGKITGFVIADIGRVSNIEFTKKN